MSEGNTQSAEVFDLTRYSAEARRNGRTLQRMSLYIIGGVVFVILLFLPETLYRRVHGGASLLEVVVTICALGFGVVIIRSAVQAYRRHRASAVALVIDVDGFEFTYATGQRQRVGWDDTTLRFDLYDSSMCPAGGGVSTRFGVSIEGRESPLPARAYDILLHESRVRDLIRMSERRSKIFYAKGWVPLIHRISASR